MLEPQPDLRPSAAEVLNLPWLRAQVGAWGFRVRVLGCNPFALAQGPSGCMGFIQGCQGQGFQAQGSGGSMGVQGEGFRLLPYCPGSGPRWVHGVVGKGVG